MMRFSGVALFSLAYTAAGEKPDGTCGYQCTADADCGGCGTAGKCSCPDGLNVAFAATSCTCASAPSDAPETPASDVADSTWPTKWTADVDAWCYGDWSNKTAVAKGKFYYDGTLGKTRADWTPYINGQDAKQVWIGDEDGKSTYFVKSGVVCLQFPITDPGQNKAPVGVEKPDWMQACKDAGYARFVAREQVRVGSEDVWADHWSCRLDYEKVNQSITFQNWHSLGLGSVPKGLPLRVTGGNSAPNPTRGSPRLNTVWYSNFITGDAATKADDFTKPNFGLCIPVGAAESEAFFGHQVEVAHAFSPSFHRRAHFMAHSTPTSRDLTRARQPKPGRTFTADTFGESMRKLNAVLSSDRELKTKACGDFSLDELHDMQRLLFDARTPELDKVYKNAGDTRRMAHGDVESLEAEQERLRRLVLSAPALAEKARAGTCHEMVMWYVHHLTASARTELKSSLVMPTLPEFYHEAPVATSENADHDAVHSRYKEQASCAICHVTPKSSDNTKQSDEFLVV